MHAVFAIIKPAFPVEMPLVREVIRAHFDGLIGKSDASVIKTRPVITISKAVLSGRVKMAHLYT